MNETEEEKRKRKLREASWESPVMPVVFDTVISDYSSSYGSGSDSGSSGFESGGGDCGGAGASSDY